MTQRESGSDQGLCPYSDSSSSHNVEETGPILISELSPQDVTSALKQLELFFSYRDIETCHMAHFSVALFQITCSLPSTDVSPGPLIPRECSKRSATAFMCLDETPFKGTTFLHLEPVPLHLFLTSSCEV